MEKLLNEIKQYREEQSELHEWTKNNGHPMTANYTEGGLDTCDKIIAIIERKDCNRMAQQNNVAWCELSLYLDTEHDEGKTEFILTVNEDKSFYIHPYGKDGRTFDGKLGRNI